MYSVVIPTMWRYKPFVRFLNDLLDVESVGEVIIINNDVKATPTNLNTHHYKLRLLNQPKNIYVNPAWNLGVEKSYFKKICIANDDIVFDTKLFARLYDLVNKDNGAFGMVCGEQQFNQPQLTDGTLDITQCNSPYDPGTHFGFGQLMFLHKDNWIPIIDGLNIYWGDHFIYDTMYYQLNRNFILSNFLFKTPHSVTCTSLEEDVRQHYHKEHALFNEKFPYLIYNVYAQNAKKTGLLL